MKTIDWLLNLAALIIWLRWLSFFSAPTRITLTLAAVVKPAEKGSKRGFFPLFIIGLIILGRAVFFHYSGAVTNFNPILDLTAISIPFKSASFMMTLLYSICSFLLFLIVFYFWLCILSVLNYKEELDIYHRKIVQHLGFIGKIPALFRLLAPFVITASLWLIVSVLFSKIGIVTNPNSFSKHILQSILLSLCLLFSLKYLVLIICALFLCYTYFYLGVHPFWAFIGVTGKRLLRPIRWIRIGPLDLSPLVMTLVFVYLCLLGEKWFPLLYQRSLM